MLRITWRLCKYFQSWLKTNHAIFSRLNYILGFCPNPHFTKSNGETSLYDPRDFNKDQFTKIEVDFETQFEAKRREKDQNASDTGNSEASGSQNEGEPSDFEIIEPLNVPLVSRNDRQNDAMGKRNAAADLEKINESFQQAFDQMFDTETKVQPKNLKKVRRTQT